jgi:hypothetical protein
MLIFPRRDPTALSSVNLLRGGDDDEPSVSSKEVVVGQQASPVSFL